MKASARIKLVLLALLGAAALSPFAETSAATGDRAKTGSETRKVIVTIRVQTVTGWEKPLVRRTPNLGHFYWMPLSRERRSQEAASQFSPARHDSRPRNEVSKKEQKPQAPPSDTRSLGGNLMAGRKDLFGDVRLPEKQPRVFVVPRHYEPLELGQEKRVSTQVSGKLMQRK